MYHPYKNGYSVLPNLSKIGPWDVFQACDDLDWYMTRKKEARKTRRTAFVHEVKPEALGAAADFIAKHHPQKPSGDFFRIARRIPEDVAVHVLDDHADWLAACDISFPSGWYPDEKIGKPLSDIHAPIPGMNLDASRDDDDQGAVRAVRVERGVRRRTVGLPPVVVQTVLRPEQHLREGGETGHCAAPGAPCCPVRAPAVHYH